MIDVTVLDEYEAGELSVLYDDAPAQEVLEWALDRFHPRMAISEGGGAEGMAILDMAVRIRDDVRVFTIDTGRLPQETYDLMENVRKRYGIQVEVLFPDTAAVEGLVNRHGPNLMYQAVDMRLLCCQVRKVQPLVKHLSGLDAWATGLRREQWASRAEVRKIEIDHDHGGIAKINPLADWTKAEVWGVHQGERRPVPRAVRPGLHVDRLRAVHPADRRGRAGPRRPVVVGEERAQGVRHPLRDQHRRVRTRAQGADRRRRRPPRSRSPSTATW